MTGAVTIDGTDIYTAYGAYILKGGDNGFISFPSAKAPPTNDWPEEDGLEVYLGNRVFNEKNLTVRYRLNGDETTFKSRLDAFKSLHFQAGYRQIYVREFEKTFSSRFSGISGYSQRRGFSRNGDNSCVIEVDYIMDDPTQFLVLATEPANEGLDSTKVVLNSVDLANFGIIVRDIYSTGMRGSAKKPLVYSSAHANGVAADTAYSPLKSFPLLTIKCSMSAPDKATFWQNYNTLWWVVNSGISLSMVAAEETYLCYYSAMENFEKKRPFAVRPRVEFDLKLTAYDKI